MVEMVKVRHNTKFATIANTVTEKLWFFDFQDGGHPPHWIVKSSNF